MEKLKLHAICLLMKVNGKGQLSMKIQNNSKVFNKQER
jgi:hypothetical protein